MCVKNTISAIRRIDLETNCEVLWVELSTGPSKVLLGTFYRPPSSTPEYLEQLEMSLASIPESHTTVLCGDFNLPHVDWAEHSSCPPLEWLVSCVILPKTSLCSSLSLNQQRVRIHLTYCSQTIQTVLLV